MELQALGTVEVEVQEIVEPPGQVTVAVQGPDIFTVSPRSEVRSTAGLKVSSREELSRLELHSDDSAAGSEESVARLKGPNTMLAIKAIKWIFDIFIPPLSFF